MRMHALPREDHFDSPLTQTAGIPNSAPVRELSFAFFILTAMPRTTIKFLFLLFLLALIACDGNTAARKAAKGPYYVSDPDHLYFKNTRLRHYNADESRQEATVYRHADLLASQAALIPVLLDNWLADQATLRFDVRTDPAEAAITQAFRLDVRKVTGWQAVPLTVPPTQEELVELRNHLATQRELRVVRGIDTLAAFPDEARKAAREVLDDYLRLVGR